MRSACRHRSHHLTCPQPRGKHADPGRCICPTPANMEESKRPGVCSGWRGRLGSTAGHGPISFREPGGRGRRGKCGLLCGPSTTVVFWLSLPSGVLNERRMHMGSPDQAARGGLGPSGLPLERECSGEIGIARAERSRAVCMWGDGRCTAVGACIATVLQGCTHLQYSIRLSKLCC